MKTNAILINLILLVSLSCDEEEKIVNSNKLTVTYGHVCGWCAGLDSITIAKDVTNLFTDYNCGDSIIRKSTATKKDQWSALKNNFDPNQFQKIDLNSCYVCADGCDTWITIISDSYYHKIRYGYNETDKLKSIQSFVDVLDSIRISVYQ